MHGEGAGLPEEEPAGHHDRVRRAGGRRAGHAGPEHGPDQGADDLLRLPRRDAAEDAEDDHPAAGGLQPHLRGCQLGHPLPGQTGGHRCRLLSGDHSDRLQYRGGPGFHHQTRCGGWGPELQQSGTGERLQ